MPKCYSQQEREYIIKRLKEEAANCLSQYGIKRTTVDEIVKRVKIPKGTFYLFYKSKELLLFDVILEQHDFVENKLMEEMKKISSSGFTVDNITQVIVQFYKLASEMPVLKLLNSDEIELLARKLPKEVLEEHLGHDDLMIEELFSCIPLKKNVNLAEFSAAFRAIYFATLHKDEIGEENIDKALYLIVSGLVSQMVDL